MENGKQGQKGHNSHKATIRRDFNDIYDLTPKNANATHLGHSTQMSTKRRVEKM